MDNYIFCATTVLVFAGVVAAKKLISNFQKVFTQIRRTKMHESEVWPLSSCDFDSVWQSSYTFKQGVFEIISFSKLPLNWLIYNPNEISLQTKKLWVCDSLFYW